MNIHFQANPQQETHFKSFMNSQTGYCWRSTEENVRAYSQIIPQNMPGQFGQVSKTTIETFDQSNGSYNGREREERRTADCRNEIELRGVSGFGEYPKSNNNEQASYATQGCQNQTNSENQSNIQKVPNVPGFGVREEKGDVEQKLSDITEYIEENEVLEEGDSNCNYTEDRETYREKGATEYANSGIVYSEGNIEIQRVVRGTYREEIDIDSSHSDMSSKDESEGSKLLIIN